MKYAITGHTDGIGKAVFEKVNGVGFSRSNGYDITIKDDRHRIISEIDDCDIFINNAQNAFGQVDMLVDLFRMWKDKEKTIINVGSVIAEDKTVLRRFEHLIDYRIQKKALKVLHNDIVNLNTKLTLKYVYFGYVGTEKILKKYPNMSPKMYITVDEAVNKILS